MRRFAALLFVVSLAVRADAQPADLFTTVNGVKLHYLDWGGTGDPLLFLTSFGASAHEFDKLAPKFTGQHHVLGLTRRGQGDSDKPPCCYDTRTLVEDIRTFLDAQHIERVTLVGYSIAGVEETQFAVTYPHRVTALVYFDAISDPKSAYELATNPGTRYPLPLPDAAGPLGEIARGARQADPDYTNVVAPALAFYVIYSEPFIPPNADDALIARLVERWKKFGHPFEIAQREHFRRDMKRGRIVELHNTDHNAFLSDPAPQSIIVREMNAFLSTH
jgi:pimeloyl-ACP methyl ester carboxylesterase